METLLLEIKEGNELIQLRKGDKGLFLLFGAKTEKMSNMYEMTLSQEDVNNLCMALKNESTLF